MTTHRRHRGPGRARSLTAALLAALAGGVVPQVAAPQAALANHATYTTPEDKLGYSACAWPAGRVVTVSVDEAYPLPDSSYSDRLDDAIVRWNQVLSTSSRAMGMARVLGPADVVVQYRPLEPLPSQAAEEHNQAIAEVYLQRSGDAEPSRNIAICPDRRPTSLTLEAAFVRMSPRGDWFTGADTELGVWQMCADESFQPPSPAVCEDSVDFGTTIVHELGHTLALYHPQTLDMLDDVDPAAPGSASRWAACGEVTADFDAQSTLCDGQTRYDSDGRTLETWDVETVHRLYS